MSITIGDLYAPTREMLERERAAVISRMEAITRDALDIEVESDGVPPSSYEREHALTDMLNGRLIEIESALSKINGGTYGICAMCSQEIPVRRLQALPFATHCVQCQSVTDKRVKRRV